MIDTCDIIYQRDLKMLNGFQTFVSKVLGNQL